MDKQELNLCLYKRVLAEFEELREELLDSPPEDILFRSYEYVIKNNIQLYLEENDISAEQAAVLMKIENPLDCIYQDWMRTDINHMSDIGDVIDYLADSLIEENAHAARKRSTREAR